MLLNGLNINVMFLEHKLSVRKIKNVNINPFKWYLAKKNSVDAYKRTFVNRKEVAYVVVAGFLSRYLSGRLPYVWLI